MLWNRKVGVALKTFDPTNMHASLVHIGDSLPSKLKAHELEVFGEDKREVELAFEGWRDELIQVTKAEAGWGTD
eukprot:1568414-Pleurochrysis_carterae.AAC.1